MAVVLNICAGTCRMWLLTCGGWYVALVFTSRGGHVEVVFTHCLGFISSIVSVSVNTFVGRVRLMVFVWFPFEIVKG